MTKIGLLIKQETERILNEKLQGADSLMLVKYSGLSAPSLDLLRSSLSTVDSSFMVVKNCVSKRIFKSAQDLLSLIEGPCGLIFVNKDLISTSRIIYKFIKENPGFEVKAGFLRDKLITGKQFEALSKVSSLSVLQSQVVGGLKSPIFGLVFGLKQILNKLAWTLGQVKDKKGKQ